MAVVLRDYQTRTVEAVIAVLPTGPTVLVAPTGSGKTLMGVTVVRRLAVPTLWVVHRRELATQAQRALRGLARVVTIQGLVARGEQPPAALVVWDECHHYVADEWRTVAEHYAHARHLGLTATPERADGRPLGDLFQHLVVAASYTELMHAQHLVPCRVLAPPEIYRDGLALRPEEAYRRYAAGTRALVFVDRVDFAEETASRLRALGLSAVAVTDKTPAATRRTALHQFETGQLRALVNIYVLTEGIDLPCVETIVLARQVSHPSTYLQIVGRALRPFPGKPQALLLDLVGAVLRFGMPTADREYALSGEAITVAKQAPPVRVCLQCGAALAGCPITCPECGYVFPRDAQLPRFYDAQLAEVWQGSATVETARRNEYDRLMGVAARRSLSLAWVAREYRLLFEQNPSWLLELSPEVRRAEYQRLLGRAREKGYRDGWAMHQYRATFGVWPWTWERSVA